MSLLEEKKAARFKLLRALYDFSGGDQFKLAMLSDLGEAVGLNWDQTDQAGGYLMQEGLLDFKAFGPLVGITHRGVKEVEEALEHPDSPTRHFLPVNVINVGVMIGSTIHADQSRSGDKIHVGGDAIGSAIGHTASVKARDIITQVQKSGMDNDLKEKLANAAEMIDALEISEDDKADATDDLGKLSEEMQKPVPEPGRVRRLLNRIKDVAPTVASLLASAVNIAKLVSGTL
jgi:hypothetical protein